MIAAKGALSVSNLGVVFGPAPRVEALADLSFEIEGGGIVCVIGTSGCGKSTLLRVVAGFLKPTSGAVWLDGAPIRGPGADRGIVFQHHALFPWLTVERNVEYGLKVRGVAKAERQARVDELLSLVGLSTVAKRYPGVLSGGMQQQVGLARVLANDPAVLLMDEPFGALDAETRLNMQELLLRMHEEQRKTVLFVTHDVEEAILLGDVVLVLSAAPGRIIKRFSIERERPRDWEFAVSKEFLEIRKEALGLIRTEGRRLLLA